MRKCFVLLFLLQLGCATTPRPPPSLAGVGCEATYWMTLSDLQTLELAFDEGDRVWRDVPYTERSHNIGSNTAAQVLVFTDWPEDRKAEIVRDSWSSLMFDGIRCRAEVLWPGNLEQDVVTSCSARFRLEVRPYRYRNLEFHVVCKRATIH